ncbi:hypothetical protein ACN28S_46925 [Cystobacter fuscus]
MSALRPTLRFGLVLSALLSLHCDPPPVEATADHRQRQNLSRIEGRWWCRAACAATPSSCSTTPPGHRRPRARAAR